MNKLLAATALSASIIYAIPASAGDSAEVSEGRMRADVEKLVSFGTRHTLSSDTDPKRGIGAARRWAADELRKTSKACGGCLEVTMPEAIVSGTRIPTPVRMVDVVAIQRGTERPNEVVIVQAHIDSRVTDVMDIKSDAPGANDDASGTSLVLEAARVLSRRKFPTTIVYAAFWARSRGYMAASCWRITPENRAGLSRPSSTTISSAAPMVPTVSSTIGMCACFPKGRVLTQRTRHALMPAVLVVKTIVPAAISLATLPLWQEAFRMISRFGRSGAPTVWGAAAISFRSWSREIRQ